MFRRTLRFVLTALVVSACSDNGITGLPDPDPDTDALIIEARGLWIATVANIDWPSRSGLSADQQRAELADIIQRATAAKFNMIILHVRPAADALYESALEPWGMMLTGTQGVSPGYDPLNYAIEQAHANGIELHAWINPFRAGNTRDTARLAASHVYNSRRDLVRIYGTQLWLDPGDPAAQEHSLNVIKDIVARYDIDAIHADDYFYPYVQTDSLNRAIPFPDTATYARYGSGMTLGDWRRANIDRFVERMYEEVHAIKPTIKVGISPFGIWRPGNPPGVNGLDAYASIYADSRKWLQQGWVDYLAPQLYWAIAAPQQSFPALLDWWLAQNPHDRHVWPGLAAYRVQDGTASAFTLQEIPNQIRIMRQRDSGGQLLYNTTWTLKQHGGQLAATLSADLFRQTAVVPASPWLDAVAPPTPAITRSGINLTITPASGEAPRWWVVQTRASGVWTTKVHFATSHTFNIGGGVERVVVRAADAAMNLSAPVTIG
jgi:uncharacterized lipoprotein YddW (UPF0748 family)